MYILTLSVFLHVEETTEQSQNKQIAASHYTFFARQFRPYFARIKSFFFLELCKPKDRVYGIDSCS